MKTHSSKIIFGLVAALGGIWMIRSRRLRASSQSFKASTEGHLERKWGDRSRDIVEEASWESFPASDSPAW